MMDAWKNTSSRRVKNATPTEWTLELKYCGRIIVHGHIDEPGIWFVSAHKLGMERVRLVNAFDGEAAKHLAFRCVKSSLEAKLAELLYMETR